MFKNSCSQTCLFQQLQALKLHGHKRGEKKNPRNCLLVAPLALNEGRGLDGLAPEVDFGLDGEEVVAQLHDAEAVLPVLAQQVAYLRVWIHCIVGLVLV